MQMNNWLFELQIYHSAEKKKQGSSLVLPEEVLICTSKDKPCWHYIRVCRTMGRFVSKLVASKNLKLLKFVKLLK